VLQRIVAAEDETVEVGGELAVIGDGSDSGTDSGGDVGGSQAPAESAAEEAAAAEPAQAHAAPSDEPQAAPRAETTSTGKGTAITMPELGESVTEGTVTRWLKQVGDSVEVDEPLLEVSTDKVDTEIPSPIAGTLLEITAGEDDTVDVGGQLAVIGDASAAAGKSAPAQEKPAAQEKQAPAPEPAKQAAPEPEAEQPSTNGKVSAQAVEQAEEQAERDELVADEPRRPEGGDAGRGAPYVTPLVRKLASEHDVDLSRITGTGVGGRIRKQDVLAAAESRKPAPEPERAPAPAAAAAPAASAPSAPTRMPKPSPDGPQPGTTVKMPRLRQVIAQRMTESLRVSAQLTTVQEVDVTRIARLRARAKAEFERREGVKLTYLPFFAKATIEALKAYPQLNASIDEESREVTYHGAVHLAIAVDTPRGLLVPVIPNADELNIAGLARHVTDLAARTRDNKVGPNELSGGTFTITNIGSSGALFDTPIINQPQVAILGTGSIVKRPVVIDDANLGETIAVRSMVYLALTYDHRLVDGADAARYLTEVKQRLEAGQFEV
jgi:2-oxoglutarate dehydrogenase E2 component (dihydrolipoamide succinyltransferase)